MNQERETNTPNKTNTRLAFLFLIVLIAIGTVFRFTNLHYAAYNWVYEVNSSQAISGFHGDEIRQELANKVVSFGELFRRYQSAHRSLKDTVFVVLSTVIPHAPLYYVILYYWASWLGPDRGVIRLLSALLGMLQLPAVYWLAMELFGLPLLAVLAAALTFISPFQLYYCQGAAPYSLHVALIAALNASFLRATRIKTLQSWLLYFFILVANMYVSINTVYIIVAHAIIILINEKPRISDDRITLPSSLLFFTSMVLCAAAAFGPFAVALMNKLPYVISSTAWMTVSIGGISLLKGWIADFISPFIWIGHMYLPRPWQILGSVFVLYCIYFCCRYSQGKVRLLLLLNVAVPFLALAVPDIIFGGIRSHNTRYMLSIPLAITIMAAYCFYNNLTNKNNTRIFWYGCLSCVVALQISYCLNVLSLYSRTKQTESPELVARVINQDKQCLIVSGELPSQVNLHQLLALSHIVRPDTRLLWLDKPDVLTLPPDTTHFYLYNPPPTLLYLIETYGYRVSPVNGAYYFLRVDVS